MQGPCREPAGLLRVCRSAARARRAHRGAGPLPRPGGFGRRFIDVAAEDLVADVVYQIGALQAIAQASGSAVSYVKPHGALYNTIVTNREQAAAVAQAVHLVDPTLPVLGMAGSAFFDEPGRLGLRTVAEAFADRAYRPDGQLVSRREPGRGVARSGGDRGPRGHHGDLGFCHRDRRHPDCCQRGIGLRAWRFAGRGADRDGSTPDELNSEGPDIRAFC